MSESNVDPQIGKNSVYRIQQNRCLPTFLPDIEGRFNKRNVVLIKVFRTSKR